jgi:hypothetical protein
MYKLITPRCKLPIDHPDYFPYEYSTDGTWYPCCLLSENIYAEELQNLLGDSYNDLKKPNPGESEAMHKLEKSWESTPISCCTYHCSTNQKIKSHRMVDFILRKD